MARHHVAQLTIERLPEAVHCSKIQALQGRAGSV